MSQRRSCLCSERSSTACRPRTSTYPPYEHSAFCGRCGQSTGYQVRNGLFLSSERHINEYAAEFFNRLATTKCHDDDDNHDHDDHLFKITRIKVTV